MDMTDWVALVDKMLILWDPLSIMTIESIPVDEYSAYAYAVAKKALESEEPEEIVDFLSALRRDMFLLDPQPKIDNALAELLLDCKRECMPVRFVVSKEEK